MTATALLSEAGGVLAAAGVPSPEWDAERLLRQVLGCDRAALLANPDRVVAAPEAERFRALVWRRASREPLQYVLGVAAFWKSEFVVTPAVLIPRPETELLVETALELVKGVERPVIVDVGTGSGCIALSIAAEREDAEVHATDMSAPALQVAFQNAQRLGLEGRVTFHEGQILEPVTGLEVDIVVSNPPYVDPRDLETLAPEVRDHEPPEALFAPGDALSIYRRLVPAAAAALREGGALAVEISPFVPSAVTRLFVEAGFEVPAVRYDLAGRPRVVCSHRSRRPSAARPVRPEVESE
ncbi:MAG TPA: peptide chain release factor N(5)-glutamine methyltransferase [Vicinamibacteria bacterium]|nr:peptide chain release factor N(5)-glutamine methyltransferase [Vicinamibacteria bacterium]